MQLEKDFTEVYNTYAPKVFRLCLGYAAGDQDRAKEWLQETFIKVWNHKKSFKEKSALGTWIYRIAVNVCLADLRKNKKHHAINEDILREYTADTDDSPQEDSIAKLYHCIEKLNEQNKILILMELENIPQQTIAATAGLSHGAVRTRMNRIRKTLLKCITNGK